jgi:hypothetical protein
MTTQTCYRAVFNVDNVDVWSSEMYLDKDAIFDEIEETKDEIADAISGESCDYSVEDDPAMQEMLTRAFTALRNGDHYQEKENLLDFFILEQPIWKNRKEYVATKRIRQ